MRSLTTSKERCYNKGATLRIRLAKGEKGMKKVRLWIISKIWIIFLIVMAIVFVVGGIVIAITSNIFAGIFISVLFFVIFFLVFYLVSYVVVIEQDIVKEKSLLGKLKKQNNLKDLTKIKVLTLRSGGKGYIGNFFVLYFSDRDDDFQCTEDTWGEDDIILFERTAKSEAILKHYTDLPIEDKSEWKKKERTKKGKDDR